MDKSSKAEQLAIIDIGSNSVRIVVMERDGKALTTKLNDKRICELGDRDSDGNIRKPNRKKAYDALEDFRAYIKKNKIERVVPVATAAARNAGNGAEFIKKAEKKLGHSIQILSDEQEAEMAARGVIAAYDMDGLDNTQPDGVVADLGGGSLELAGVRKDSIDDAISLELGTLILRAQDDPAAYARRALNATDYAGKNAPNLYVIGGSWRAVKKTWNWSGNGGTSKTNGAINTKHMQSVPANAAVKHLEHIINLEGSAPSKKKKKHFPKELDKSARALYEEFPKIRPERANKIFDAARVLKELVEVTGAKNVVFVECGLREAIAHAHFSNSPLMQETGQLFSRLHAEGDDDRPALAKSGTTTSPSEPLSSHHDDGVPATATGKPRSFSQKS